MYEEIKEQINQIVDSIYKYDINKVMNLIGCLFNSIDVSLQKNEFENVNSLNKVLTMMEEAMNNKDYLLLADILKFELFPIIPNKYIN
ncbi:hypothetical protein [Clostridium magnum]|uniref:Uncharacterized protein n=1 Tax=Clostridium magnum DSM 2767 TaxID=1121326 RepID=A0A162UMN2_9CLOT|nr:hypothetical protein [Clostridium magnum]KZL94085.1 hypothetical protein CLMAG_11380 [Clostridium magnum DSM 2767]SHH95266.1 hypothetical protein SAMN02745944_01912 [Clostridium magnum DSM 2767]